MVFFSTFFYNNSAPGTTFWDSFTEKFVIIVYIFPKMSLKPWSSIRRPNSIHSSLSQWLYSKWQAWSNAINFKSESHAHVFNSIFFSWQRILMWEKSDVTFEQINQLVRLNTDVQLLIYSFFFLCNFRTECFALKEDGRYSIQTIEYFIQIF